MNAILLRQIEALLSARAAFCVATLVDARGSIPQVVGARALFTRDGLFFGTVGGGRLESRCREIALEMLAGEAGAGTRFARFNLMKDLGMTCAGEAAVFFEVQRPDLDWDIVIFGAGHVAQKLCRFLVELDCRVTCIDVRADWLDRLPRAEALEAVQVPEFEEGVRRVRPQSMVLVMTMGHATDVPVLKAIAAAALPLPYLGVIGSKSKGQALRRELAREGLDPAFVDRIVCPVGEKVGNNTPAEIAVGIVSQLVRVRRSSGGNS